MAWAPDYVTADDLREYVTNSDEEIPADEAQYPRAIAAASRSIDRHCRRQFGLVAAPEARYYRVRRVGAVWLVDTDDLMTGVGLLVGGVAPATSALRPRNAAAIGQPWTGLALDACPDDEWVEVTARWGWTTVPVPVEEACLLQASRLVLRRSAPFGIAGSPDSGSEMRLLAKVDPDVAVTLEPYRKRARPQ